VTKSTGDRIDRLFDNLLAHLCPNGADRPLHSRQVRRLIRLAEHLADVGMLAARRGDDSTANAMTLAVEDLLIVLAEHLNPSPEAK
jgi:hypothetical protein